MQICSSLGTVDRANNGQQELMFSSLSLCENQRAVQTDADGASEYENKKNYVVGNQSAERTIFADDVNGLRRGQHGNFVSNALYNFDRTVIHRPIQIFGIEIDSAGARRWRASNSVPGLSYEELVILGEPPGWNVVRVLDYVSRGVETSGNNFNQLTDLGAINISLAQRGQVAVDQCNTQLGGDAVNRLYALGIPVVVGVPNQTLGVDELSWPACLENVVSVGGLTSPALGVGANGTFKYFAKDTAQFPHVGNSFAAPRVAAAYALLHEIYPNSTVSQKDDALSAANSYRERTTPHGIVIGRFIEKKNMGKAIAELGKVVAPAELNLPDVTLGYFDPTVFGPVYGGSQPTASFVIQLPDSFSAGAATSLLNDNSNSISEAVGSTSATSSIQDLQRDVLLQFTAEVQSSDSDVPASLSLFVNGVQIAIFSGFPPSESAIAQFVINRRHFRPGNNNIEIRPIDAGDGWGVRDVSANYLPIIPLELGVTDNNEYGSNGNPRYITSLRATFNLSSVSADGVELSMEGWDIDISNETTIFMNGRYVGRMAITEDDAYGATETFIVSPAKLRQGTNYIEFIQREPDFLWSGVEDEKWAVRNLKVMPLLAPIIQINIEELLPIINLILLDE